MPRIIEHHQHTTSLNAAERFLAHVDLERVARSDKRVVGSDAWLDVVMNFAVETEAIDRCRQNFYALNPELNQAQLDFEFNTLLDMWLTAQYAFCLSENGCGKYLQIQPTYYFSVIKDEVGHQVTPSDLSKFGDLSKKYVETNPRVGQGLMLIYKSFAEYQRNKMAVVVSGTEEYQDYNSLTDVINLMRAIHADGNTTFAEGKYLVLNQVLSTTERRFVHNLIYLLSEHKISIEELRWASVEELIKQVKTDQLLAIGAIDHDKPEYQQMVMHPNIFNYQSSGEDELYDFAILLNDVFQKRFGKKLIEPKDLEMYPKIKQLVENYLPSLKEALWATKNKKAYYAILRRMIYHTQGIWATGQETIASYRNYLDEMSWGMIPVGFEFSFGDLSDPLSIFSNPWQYPMGFEASNQYCETHKKFYEGGHCPECQEKPAVHD